MTQRNRILTWSLLSLPLLAALAVWLFSISAVHTFYHLNFDADQGPASREWIIICTPLGIHFEYAHRTGRAAMVSYLRPRGPMPPEGWSYERDETYTDVSAGFDVPKYHIMRKHTTSLGEMAGWRIMLPWLTLFPLATMPLLVGLVWRWWHRRRARRNDRAQPVVLKA